MTNYNLSKGRYSYPVRHGSRYISKRKSPAHTGNLRYSIDFIVPIGTAVYASANGKVVDLKSNGKLGGDSRKFEKHGNFIEIYHGQYDEYSEYEHLSKIHVRLGDAVKRGDKIGESGATGWLGGLGPHLHWMIGIYMDYHTVRPRIRKIN